MMQVEDDDALASRAPSTHRHGTSSVVLQYALHTSTNNVFASAVHRPKSCILSAGKSVGV